MKVLVTGAGGFIGSHLCEALVKKGYDVRAFLRYNSQNSWGWLDKSDANKEIECVSGDIRDFDSVSKAMKNIEKVFHLAALISIPYSYESQQSFVDVNIKGTLNVLQSALENKVKKIIHTSTSEAYGTAIYTPIDEKHPKQGQSPYSATKIGADFLAQSFFRSFGLPVVIARPFNTYGPRQSARAIIPTIITQLLSGKKNIKLGSLHPKRDFVFVNDTVQGFIEIDESKKTLGEEINIATQQEISIGELVQVLDKIINSKFKIQKDSKRIRPVNSEVDQLLGSNEKIKKLTNWKQRYSLEQGLKKTVEWFRNKENLSLYKYDRYNV
ncbi:MAG: NAD-dependent 4,6-dehydratase LegB [Candidatus Omnitrophota bacterium]